MTRLTDERLAGIRARAEAASRGEWYDDRRNDGLPIVCNGLTQICYMYTSAGQGVLNAEFIARAHADIPDLLDEVERLRAENDGYKADIEAGRVARLPAAIGQMIYVPSGDGGIYAAYVKGIGVLRPETHDAIMCATVRVGLEGEVLEYLIALENKGTRWFETEAEAHAALREEREDG